MAQEDAMRRNIFRNSLFYMLVFIVIVGVASMITGGNDASNQVNISSTEFIQQLEEDQVQNFSLQPSAGVYKVEGQYTEPIAVETEDNTNIDIFSSSDEETEFFTTTILQNDPLVADIYNLAQEKGTEVIPIEEEQTGIWTSLLISFLPLLIFIFFIYLMMNQAGQGGGGGKNVMSFGKSKAKLTDPSESKVRFSDVAGANEEKAELVEIVDFLKDPRRFTGLGARIPAGVLLEGPPGTGKTLLAKAVAGEAGVPFYSISGSEFVEMFVGVGASRVRDLFEEAKKNSPSIIFIDEIDAVGRKRGSSGMSGGNDEREQTLNQLLVEMDGFQGNEGVIVMAATNRSDVLDQALLRPGRFDRRIMVGMPDVKEREAILKVHAKTKPLAGDVDLRQVAKTTPGFSGADLENLLNESAIVAARRRSETISPYDIDEASDRVIAGPAKKDRAISEKERIRVAYHEAGHTVVGMVLSEARVVHKVTIVPRGRAGGYAIMLPREDQYLYTKKDLSEQLVGLLGGRVAEEIFFDSQSSGASNDFEQATDIARKMVTQYGMSDRLGPVQYESGKEQSTFDKTYSERVAYEIDQEVLTILNDAHQKAHEIIGEHREELAVIAEKLLEVETLNADEITSLFEKGVMPDSHKENDYPSESDTDLQEETERGASFEEIREQVIEGENEREEEFDDNHHPKQEKHERRNDHVNQDHESLDERNSHEDSHKKSSEDSSSKNLTENDWD